MSKQENILQIIPATGWVAVYDVDGVETAESVVCFALVEGDGRGVRAMRADGKRIAFADEAANFLRVEELADFEDEDEEEEEDEEDEE
ncbi:hypothetical protein [Dyella amyloliquefaciens]|jgi:hypothetical protein|uniref:hypothetical protein n=1 Tax=Dyella amyloliquefaciens TaxID=1770545 RepID=UPI0013EE5551|nr:hypothetical protein [Dyella amyloliquefaciens]